MRNNRKTVSVIWIALGFILAPLATADLVRISPDEEKEIVQPKSEPAQKPTASHSAAPSTAYTSKEDGKQTVPRARPVREAPARQERLSDAEYRKQKLAAANDYLKAIHRAQNHLVMRRPIPEEYWDGMGINPKTLQPHERMSYESSYKQQLILDLETSSQALLAYRSDEKDAVVNQLSLGGASASAVLREMRDLSVRLRQPPKEKGQLPPAGDLLAALNYLEILGDLIHQTQGVMYQPFHPHADQNVQLLSHYRQLSRSISQSMNQAFMINAQTANAVAVERQRLEQQNDPYYRYQRWPY